MPALITKPEWQHLWSVFAQKDLFAVSKRGGGGGGGGRSDRGIVFLWHCVCEAYAQPSVWKRGSISPHTPLQLIFYQHNASLPAGWSLPAARHIHLHFKQLYNSDTYRRRVTGQRERVWCLRNTCVSGRDRHGLNVQMASVNITEINWGPATHLDHRALSPGLRTHTYVDLCSEWIPLWWNCTGWRLCQVNNTDWSLMLNFLEVPAGLSASRTCSVLQLPPGCTVGCTGISGSITAPCLPAGHPDPNHGSEENRGGTLGTMSLGDWAN